MKRLPEFFAAILLACATAAFASAPTPAGTTGSRPPVTPDVERMLTAMDNSSTWGHPDLFGEFAGMRRYFEGDYEGAMKYFKYGARYSDKLSQATIGMMYLNGEGVAKDPVTACAWLELAAERHYPSIVAARDRVCNTLAPAQSRAASRVLDQLLPEYGDAVAKVRLTVELTKSKREMTGSRVGHDFGVGTVNGAMGSPSQRGGNCGPTMSYGGYSLPSDRCSGGDFWSPWLWNPEEYFSVRDAAWRGTVTVGPLKVQSPPAPQGDAKPQSSDESRPASGSSAGH